MQTRDSDTDSRLLEQDASGKPLRTFPHPDLSWTPQGPRSERFDDIYFSAIDGLAEARAVFLQGCGLPDGWAGRRRFVVGELGFGTGLNIAALLELWRRTRPPEGRLNIFSVEAYPLSQAEAARALTAWPELEMVARPLLAVWPDARRGFHRLDLDPLHATLDLWIGEAADGLDAWRGAADAWFLDGFAPARNPQMWRQEVLDLVCAHSRPGARLATFTVAGAVRRGLEQAGARIEKKPGFGAKRERLEAWIEPLSPARPSRQAPPPRIAIVGAGVAGAALARAFGREGVQALVIDEGGPGAGASGNPSALVTPRLDAGLGAAAVLHAEAFARAIQLYARETPDAIIDRGAVQLETTPRDAARFAKLEAWDGFAPGALSTLTPGAIGERLGETPTPGGLSYADALVIAPQAVLATWLADTAVCVARVERLEPWAGGWRLLDLEGETIAEADAVILAGGPASRRLAPDGPAAALMAVRGQASWTSAPRPLGGASAWGGYAIPTADGGVLFGSSHVRHDWGVEVRAADDAHNLTLLAQGRPALAEAIASGLASSPLQARASLRAATPDHMPLAGRLGDQDGLYILAGLGARGFTLAPLLAEHIAAETLGAPSPLQRCVIAAIVPARFERKGGA
jgi:tRNA 5-methylaminomethyl-2-thiouridine biosynthesis bifunctional protein